jgi:serine protease
VVASGALVAIVGLIAGLLTFAAPAQAASSNPGMADGRYDVVFGLIVRRAPNGTSARTLATTVERAGVDVASVRSLTRDITVLNFADPMTFAEAESIERAVAREPGVLGVEPNRIVFAQASPTATPVIPNDPYFSDQWGLWDGGGAADYSVRAPLLWGTTTGAASVVVGVVDTGQTSHPDLQGQTVPGFDFIADVVDARDGNAWDSDPADMGTWCDDDGSPSDWHGTHVAGIINGIQNNATGISGLAPGVRVQHLRVLGACGMGTSADILSAVIWGSGGDLSAWWGAYPGADPGVNATPARVLNLSLGGAGTCDVELSQVIFAEARARGTTVVAAAGNEGVDVATSWPANCPGVVSVAASTRSGNRADYSNYGTAPGAIDISAPGGSGGTGSPSAILSTMNLGAFGPGGTGYAFYNGTSMAAPHVSAAFALAYSLGATNAAQAESMVLGAVRPFPAGGNCSTLACGAGLLDVSKLVASGVPGTPTDLAWSQTGTTEITLTWSAPDDGGSAITSYDIASSTDGGSTWETAGSSPWTWARVVLSPGVTYRFRVAARNDVGLGPWSTATGDVRLGDVRAPGAPTDVTATPGDGSAAITWTAPSDTGGSTIVGYTASLSASGSPGVTCITAVTSCAVENLANGTTYTVVVTATNADGFTSAASEPITVTPSGHTVPGVVRSVRVRWKYTSTGAKAILRWAAPADDGGAAVTRYRARMALVGASYGSWVQTRKTVIAASNLRVGRTYRVQIQARNALGWGTSYTVRLRP